MMKPIYFPFTTIAGPAAQNLSRLLGRFIVFQPRQDRRSNSLRQCEQNGWIDVKAPWTVDEDRLTAFFNEFKDWGHRHHGAEASLKAAFETGFYNQSFVAQIRTDIVKNRERESEAPDPEFLARLFLIMAEDLDLRQMELDQDLRSSAGKERELFYRMTGDEKTLAPSGDSLFQSDLGAYMTGQRLAAWFRLMQKNGPESAFLFTDSPAVADMIKERLTDLEMMATFDGISWRQPDDLVQQLNQAVAHWAATPWSGRLEGEMPDLAAGDGQDVALELHILPGSAPEDLGRFFFKMDDPKKTHENKYLNTIIGILKPLGKKYKKT